MPGPYSFPTDRVTGGPSPAADVNALGAALNEADTEATPNVLALRDAEGNLKTATPADAADATPKTYVDQGDNARIPKEIIDLKGDLIVGSGDNTPGRLAVGADGQVPMADSSAPLGVSYQDLPAPTPGLGEVLGVDGGLVVSRFTIIPTGTSNIALSSSEMRIGPMPIYAPCRLRSIIINVTTAGNAGARIHIWLYGPGAQGSLPTELIYDFGDVAGDATNGGLQITPATPIDLVPNYYALMFGASGVTTTAPGVSGGNSAMPFEFPYRSRSTTRLDLATRGGTGVVLPAGITPDSAPPAQMLYNSSATAPNTYDISGGRMPIALLDLIPAA